MKEMKVHYQVGVPGQVHLCGWIPCFPKSAVLLQPQALQYKRGEKNKTKHHLRFPGKADRIKLTYRL